jgi:hypothetical protein
MKPVYIAIFTSFIAVFCSLVAVFAAVSAKRKAGK